MPEQTSAELEKQIAELQAKHDSVKAAEDEAAKHPREPEAILLDVVRTVGAHLGNPPRLEKLAQELEKVLTPPPKA